MKQGYVHDIRLVGDDNLRQIFTEALLASYAHICQIFSAQKGYNRDKSDNSFSETLDSVLADKSRHITIIYMDIVNVWDLKHWEFGMSSDSHYLNIKVKPSLAVQIFEKHGLRVISYYK